MISQRADFSRLATRSAAAVLLLVALNLLGCGNSLDREPIEGAVSLNGQPVGAAMIVLVERVDAEADDDGPARPARYAAPIDSGRFFFTTNNGPPPGEYEVLIQPAEPEFEAVDAARKAGQPLPLDSTPIPSRYGSPGVLFATVAADQSEPFHFELTGS